MVIAGQCLRAPARSRFFNVMDLVDKFEVMARASRQGRLVDKVARLNLVVFDDVA